MIRTLIAGAVSVVLATTFSVPAHADPSPCDSVTTYPLVEMPAPWTPASLCEAREALLDHTPLPKRDVTA